MTEEVPKKNLEGGNFPTLRFSEFLEDCPPNQRTHISDLRRKNHFSRMEPDTPELTLQCREEPCQGDMLFKCIGSDSWRYHYLREWHGLSLAYECKNCGKTQKLFSLLVTAPIDEEDVGGVVVKLGEWPPFGPRTPNRVLKTLGADKDLFLSGRSAENQGLGIGAFTYYRRVVENQKNRLIDEIIKVVEKVEESPEEVVAKLEQAKETFQFSRSIEDIKLAIPPQVEIKGHNPLVLLHSALSAGIHGETDSDCLETAKNVRLILVELVDRLQRALSEEKELNEAVSELLKNQSKK